MRRPRRHAPGQFLDITVRCQRSEFRFLPVHERTEALGYWLARAHQRFPGVAVVAVCQMSNHLHLVVHDRVGQISDFMQYFLGHAAKRINRIDELRGSVFERRFAEIVILDHGALMRRVAYAINNPVEANLVRSYREWPGLCLFASATPVVRTFELFDERGYHRALDEAAGSGAAVRRDDYIETARLELAPLEPDLADGVAATIEERAIELLQHQPAVLGTQRVLASSPFDRPKMSDRSAMPLCFASTRDRRAAFTRGWHDFVAAFRQASSEFRRGFLAVVFPPFSFRPSTAAG